MNLLANPIYLSGFSGGSMVNNPPANVGDEGSIPGSGKSPGEGNGNLVFLPGKPYGQRSLAGYSPWGYKKSDMTEGLSTWRTKIPTYHRIAELTYHNQRHLLLELRRILAK